MSSVVPEKQIIRDDFGPIAIEAVVVLSLSELIELDIEELNDYVEHLVLNDAEQQVFILSNIYYHVISCDPGENSINVQVSADLETY